MNQTTNPEIQQNFYFRMKNEPCNNGRDAPVGKKIICRQKYVKITLKAFKGKDQRTMVDGECKSFEHLDIKSGF